MSPVLSGLEDTKRQNFSRQQSLQTRTICWEIALETEITSLVNTDPAKA